MSDADRISNERIDIHTAQLAHQKNWLQSSVFGGINYPQPSVDLFNISTIRTQAVVIINEDPYPRDTSCTELQVISDMVGE